MGPGNPLLITESEADMNYNAGQVTLRQRTHHGLEYTVNYTYAKSLTNSSGNYGTPNVSGSDGAYQDAYNPHADWGPSGMDIRHSLNFVGVYDLPFGQGRTYGSGANSYVNAVFGGWKVSASAFLYSGFSITINGPGSSNTNSFGQSRANHYRKLVVHDRSIDHWWGTDPSAISTNCSATGSGRWKLRLRRVCPTHVSAPRASTRSAAPVTARSTLPSSKTFTYQNVTSSDSGRTSSTFSI